LLRSSATELSGLRYLNEPAFWNCSHFFTLNF
jgi:hypothetical protein